jgi:hypothetical protein
MATTTDRLRTQVTETQTDLDRRLDEIRQVAEFSVRKYAPAAGGILGGVGLVAGAVLLIRSRHQPTLTERLGRTVPTRFGQLGSATTLAVRRGMPPTRIYISELRPGRESRSRQWRRVGMRFAESVSSAAGGAAFAYAIRKIRPLKSKLPNS